MTALEVALRVAYSHLGEAYRWRGDDSIDGFDCSGLAIEILKSSGRLPREGDWSAAQLKDKFPEIQGPKQGALVFWKNAAGAIIHVEFCLDETFALGASGGDSSVVDGAAAAKKNAFVKIRPIASRAGIAGYVDPFV